MAVCWVCFPSYSYSDTAYGVSGNAAIDGYSWVAKNILPAYTGLAVNGVVYEYSTVKNPEDDMIVYVYNENTDGNGYVFRETNDWSGQPGNRIRRLVPIGYVPREEWGNGGIDIEGNGEVVDASVIFTYRYDDTCVADPQANPSCPDYVQLDFPEAPEYEEPDLVQENIEREQVFLDEDEERREYEMMKDKEKKRVRLQELEALLGGIQLNAMQGPSELLHVQMISLNYLTPAYDTQLSDPGYEETIVLDGGELQDNARARRNFALDQTHQQMVNSQYEE